MVQALDVIIAGIVVFGFCLALITIVVIVWLLVPNKRAPEVEAELIQLYVEAFNNATQSMIEKAQAHNKALDEVAKKHLDQSERKAFESRLKQALDRLESVTSRIPILQVADNDDSESVRSKSDDVAETSESAESPESDDADS